MGSHGLFLFLPFQPPFSLTCRDQSINLFKYLLKGDCMRFLSLLFCVSILLFSGTLYAEDTVEVVAT